MLLVATYVVALLGFIGLFVADVVTTLVVIGRGSVEANPVVTPLLSHDLLFIAVKMAALSVFVYVFERARRRRPQYLKFQVGALAVLSLLYIVAVRINLLGW